MLLKSADDKSKRLALLEELQRSQVLDSTQKKWLRDELMRLKKGIQGERESAHYLDSYFKDGKNHVVLHDLRFVIDGDVAQVDHLIINRVLGIYLLETKNYSGNLVINDHGEFTVQYDDARFGIPSPIEQSLRHERLICKLLERLDIVGRTQKQAEFHHVVMLHPKAIIGRPPPKDFDTSNVIKADQFPTWHQRFVDKLGTGTVFKSMFNLRNLDTIAEWGEKLKRQHRPADLLALPDFMRPLQPFKRETSVSSIVPPIALGNMTGFNELQSRGPSLVPVSQPSVAPAKRLICSNCAAKISFAEGKFCWNNTQRFSGLAYCRAHQALF
jgi:Nuclease-related domain